MRRVEDTSTATPIPVVVETGSVPKARDSARNFAVEVATPASERQVQRSRGFIKKLIIPTVAAVGLVGPNTLYQIGDNEHTEEKAAMAKIEMETPPSSLQSAQTSAAFRLFGLKGKGINVDAAREVVNKPGKGELLDANSYVNPEQVQVSEDGKFFTVEGKDYELARRKTEEGNVYILAGQHFVEEGIISDRERLVGSLLVGGAKNDLSSDLNKDGVVTPEEVTKSADQSARHNLDRAFQPPQRIVVGQNDVKQK